MNRLFTLLCLLAAVYGPYFLQAQCSEFDIVMLQAVQRAEADKKDAQILSYGFDLFATQNGNRIFNKCWRGNVDGKAIYEQRIILEPSSHSYTFMTLNRDHFVRLRSSIEDRNGGAGQTEDPNLYIGRMFRYRFGVQSYDGHEYFKVTIRDK